MDGLPLLHDYGPTTLLAIVVLMVLAGLLVPYRAVKEKDARIAFLESALERTQEALAEEQKTGAVVRHFFDGLSQGVGQ